MKQVQVGDIVLFQDGLREGYGAGVVTRILRWEDQDDTLYKIRPLAYRGESVFAVNVVVRCIISFAGPVPLENLDALSNG